MSIDQLSISTTRRNFLKASATAAGGFSLGVMLPGCATLSQSGEEKGTWEANAWLEIAKDGRITFVLDRVEMGQGTYTGLTTLIAEELDVAPSTIEVEYAPVANVYRNPDYGLQMTGGSNSMSSSWGQIRHAGATARMMLHSAGASVFQSDMGECKTEDGKVIHVGTGKVLGYGELTELAARQPVPDNPTLKAPHEFKYIGKQNKRLDIQGKVTGKTDYGIDIEVPDMLYAVLTRAPVYGAKVVSFDKSEAWHSPGVHRIFETSGGVAVLAGQYWQARKAQTLLKVSWSASDKDAFSSAGMFDAFKQAADADAGKTIRSEGDFDDAVAQAGRVFEATYHTPFLAHATLEPMNCVVSVEAGKATVWAPTQAPDMARIAVAKVTNLSPSDVTVHVTAIGGGFGRRLTQDFVAEAAEISAIAGKPVKLIWSREEDTRHDWFRPATWHRLRATFDQTGGVTGWDHQIVAPKLFDWFIDDAAPAQYPWSPKFTYGLLGKMGLAMQGIIIPEDSSPYEGADNVPYQFSSISVRHTHADAGVPISFWRSVGHSQNAFYVESFIDELAHESGEDPYEFRVRHLKKDSREHNVLARVAKLARWGSDTPAGIYRGIAVHESFHSYVAQVVEISVEAQAEIRVHRVYCVVDCGIAVNPDVVRSQMESGIIFGITAALYGEITYDNGQVQQSNFDDYPLLRMQKSPEIIVEIVESKENPSGVGEPGVPPIAPAIANAVFRATGQRPRSLPLRLPG